jgi:hypothetical protein
LCSRYLRSVIQTFHMHWLLWSVKSDPCTKTKFAPSKLFQVCPGLTQSFKFKHQCSRAAKSHGLPVSLQVFALTSRSHGWSWKSHGFSQKYN